MSREVLWPLCPIRRVSVWVAMVFEVPAVLTATPHGPPELRDSWCFVSTCPQHASVLRSAQGCGLCLCAKHAVTEVNGGPVRPCRFSGQKGDISPHLGENNLEEVVTPECRELPFPTPKKNQQQNPSWIPHSLSPLGGYQTII